MPYRYPIQFGKYLLIQRVAVGGMAEVFKAKLIGPRGFEKTLALKKILPEFSQDDDFVQMFVDEARISSHLHHANIVQVYDFGEVAGSYYIAMEYVDGANLKSLFQKTLKSNGKLQRNLALYFALEIARALEYAHNVSIDGEQVLNLIHRDISPQNILISRDGDVKITDFGIAKANIKLTKTQPGKVQGKLSYMSPEQATGRAIDRRSDLFSLGVILYELLTGVKVYAGGNTGEKYLKIRNAEIPAIQTLIPDLDGPIINLVTSMLAKEPQDRPASAALIVQTLAEILATTSKEDIQNQIKELVLIHFPPEKSDSSLGRRIQAVVSRGGVLSEPETQVRTGILNPIFSTESEDLAELKNFSPPASEKTRPIHKITEHYSIKALAGFAAVALLAITSIGVGIFRIASNQNEVVTARKITPPEVKDLPPSLSSEPEIKSTIAPGTLGGPVDGDMKEEAMIRQMEMEEKIKDLEDQVKEAEVRAAQKASEAKIASQALIQKKKLTVVKPKESCPPGMVFLKPGNFYFGSGLSDPDRNELVEVSQHIENFSRGFCIDTYEFPNKKGAKPSRQKNWTDALAQCSQMGKRLCTQEEWERSCRGSESNPHPKRIYPYGNTWKSKACAVIEDEEVIEEGNNLLVDTGSHPMCKSPEGVYDMIGNAEEWTQSQGIYGNGNRVVKGGSLTGSSYLARCSSRREIASDTRRDELGFRCCKDSN